MLTLEFSKIFHPFDFKYPVYETNRRPLTTVAQNLSCVMARNAMMSFMCTGLVISENTLSCVAVVYIV